MKRNMAKRIGAILFMLIMVFQVLPFSAAAAETETPSQEEETKTCTVIYRDGFGNTLYKKTVKSGGSVKPYGKRPTHPGFLFTCWDKKLPKVITEDITITALWAINKSVPLTLTVFADAKINGNDTQKFQQLVSTAVNNRGEVSALATTGNLVDRYDDMTAWNAIRNTVWTLPEDMYFYNVAGKSDVNGDVADYSSFYQANLCRAYDLNFYAGGAVWFQKLSREGVMLMGVGYHQPAETGVEKERQYIWIKYLNDAARIHVGYSVVLLVSDYMDSNGNLTDFGKLLEEEFVSVNPNVRLVVCGNGQGTARADKNYGGYKVTTVQLGAGAEGMTNLIFNLTDHSVNVTSVPSGGESFTIDNAF